MRFPVNIQMNINKESLELAYEKATLENYIKKNKTDYNRNKENTFKLQPDINRQTDIENKLRNLLYEIPPP